MARVAGRMSDWQNGKIPSMNFRRTGSGPIFVSKTSPTFGTCSLLWEPFLLWKIGLTPLFLTWEVQMPLVTSQRGGEGPESL